MRKWKKEEKERDRGTEDETSYLDALIGEEEQMRKWKKEEKERERSYERSLYRQVGLN